MLVSSVSLYYSVLLHLYLHSFPTRRSSDLTAPVGGARFGIAAALGACSRASRDERLPRRARPARRGAALVRPDRKSTRLNSSHLGISYAVFCLKKKKNLS